MFAVFAQPVNNLHRARSHWSPATPLPATAESQPLHPPRLPINHKHLQLIRCPATDNSPPPLGTEKAHRLLQTLEGHYRCYRYTQSVTCNQTTKTTMSQYTHILRLRVFIPTIYRLTLSPTPTLLVCTCIHAYTISVDKQCTFPAAVHSAHNSRSSPTRRRKRTIIVRHTNLCNHAPSPVPSHENPLR